MVLQCGATDRGLVEALAGFGIDIETAMPDAEEDFVRMLDDCPTGTVNLRSCGRSANHISLIDHTRPGESRRRTGENRPRIAQVDAMKGRGLRSS
ncbi:MAG: hypothetical protein ABWY68_09320 [Cryobacterium sp.]